jgi:tetratricopeptide (TPR) repeat protein
MAPAGPIPSSLTRAMLLGVLLVSSAPAAEPPWLELHSTHFTVITDAGEKKGREVALRFEQMRAVFASLLAKDRLHLPVPLTILALKSDKAFYQMAPLRQGQPISVPGFFVPGDDQNFIVLNLFEEESWRAVAHDFAHMLLNYNYPPAQGWFDEGLAEYFCSIRVDNKRVEIGSDPELGASFNEDLLQNQRELRTSKSLTEFLGGQVWLSMADLFTMKHDTSTYREGTHHTLFYAQSWMVMHYVLNQKKLPETGTYFDLVQNQHVPVEEAISKAYGMSSAQFEQAVKDYFHSLRALFTALDASKQPGVAAHAAQVYQLPVAPGPDDMVISSKPLPDTDARALAAEVKVRIPERRELGLKELQALAAAGPESHPTPKPSAEQNTSESNSAIATGTGNEIAHRVLAWDHIQHGEFDEAAEELGNAAAVNQHDMWIRYYLSLLKYRIAQSKHLEIQGLANMMQDLRAVLDWYPEFADADDLLGVARMEGGGPVAAMQAERAAIQLSPRNEQYDLHLAEIYLAGKNWEAAKALLERLKASGNAQIAAIAREKLGQISNEQKYGMSSATGAAAANLTTQKSPFDALVEDAAERAAAQTKSEAGPDKRPSQYLKGKLVTVDCSHSPAATLTIASGAGTVKLRTGDFKSLLLIGADQFSCEWRDRSVSVNYKAAGQGAGDLVSLEIR